MAIEKLKIDAFLPHMGVYPIIDVRSPGEYQQAHIPAAESVPLFTDEERKIVGTIYKQESRQQAIKAGLDFFGPKMRAIVEQCEEIAPDKTIIVHCWRGGMRSAAVAWLLDLYGFKVYTIIGGYKAYRRWAIGVPEQQHNLHLIGGYTGSGKTIVLHELRQKGHYIIDLEGLACHKGSAFGAIGQPLQPRQEMFENLLAYYLYKAPAGMPIWIEDESQRIGGVNIPHALWKNMRSSPLFFIDIPFEERLNYIVQEYGTLPVQELCDAILRIQKRLGGLATKNALQYLQNGDLPECFRILLAYYDKQYQKGLHARDNLHGVLHQLDAEGVNAQTNAEQLLQHITTTHS
jgi:tRNA 2-selenouridine synthase